jgi:RimJ/RimL family protein N-acetyltransferase
VIDADLVTARLRLSPLRADDVDEWFVTLDDPHIGTYIGGPDVTTREALAERVAATLAGPPAHFDEDEWVNLIVRRADGLMVGRVEATITRRPGEAWAEIAYVFAPAHQGQGYASEATAALLQALAADGVGTVLAAVHPDNAASVRLLQRLGFEQLAAPDRPMATADPGDLVFRR